MNTKIKDFVLDSRLQNVLFLCAFVCECECEDVASVGTMQLPNPDELLDAAGSLQKFTWGVR
jgi:hypothetical protein